MKTATFTGPNTTSGRIGLPPTTAIGRSTRYRSPTRARHVGAEVPGGCPFSGSRASRLSPRCSLRRDTYPSSSADYGDPTLSPKNVVPSCDAGSDEGQGRRHLAVLRRRRPRPRRRAGRLPRGRGRRDRPRRRRHDGEELPGLVQPVIRRDILDTPTREILRAAGLQGRERPDLLVGGPPCTPFSKSGFWLDWKRAGLDPDASLLQAYTRVLAEARPRRSSWRTSTPSPTTTRRAGRRSSGCSARSTRPATAATVTCSTPPTSACRSFAHASSSSACRSASLSLNSRAHPRRPVGTSTIGTVDVPHVTTGEALAGVETTPEPEEVVRGQWGHLLPEIPAR